MNLLKSIIWAKDWKINNFGLPSKGSRLSLLTIILLNDVVFGSLPFFWAWLTANLITSLTSFEAWIKINSRSVNQPSLNLFLTYRTKDWIAFDYEVRELCRIRRRNGNPQAKKFAPRWTWEKQLQGMHNKAYYVSSCQMVNMWINSE